MYKLFLSMVLSTLLSAEVYDGIAIIVQDRAITILDIKKEMQISHSSAKKASDTLIRQKLEEAEIQKRSISVTSEEVYADVKKMAERNQMSISEFYDAIRETNGMSSSELKKKISQKLLSQKLYSAIAYSSVEEPSESEIQAYFEQHKKSFEHPSSFDVIVYDCKHKGKLQQKIANPMFFSPDIHEEELTFEYQKISPSLAKLLEDTPLNSCSEMVPNGKGGYVSFYLKSLQNAEEIELKDVKSQIINKMMGEQREQVLGDYFARLKHNADINMIRSVE